MPRITFLVFIGFVITAIATFSVYSYIQSKKKPYALAIARVFLSTFLTLFFYAGTLASKSRTNAVVFYSLYFASIDWLLFTFFDYIRKVILKHNQIKGVKYLIMVMFSLTILDTISLFMNISFDTVFILKGKYNPFDDAIDWIVKYLPAYKLHLGLCYMLTIPIFLGLLRNTIKSSRFFFRQYLLIIVTFAAYYILNAISLEQHWTLDYSILLFGPMAAELFILNFYFIPRGNLASMLLPASDDLQDAIACFDADDKCFYMNKCAQQFFGSKAEGKRAVEQYLINWAAVNVTFSNYKSRKIVSNGKELQVNGEKHIVDIEFQRQYDSKNRFIASFLSFKDRTEEIKRLEAEHFKATHDTLTGLFNREAFFNEVSKILKENKDNDYYLLCTDILNFKFINDIFGKEMGDRILQFEAKILTNDDVHFAASGRINGDIFAVLIDKNDFEEDEILRYTRNILNLTKNMNYKMTMQIGVYEITNKKESVVSMFDKAHIAVQSIRDSYDQIISFYDTRIMEQMINEKNIIGEFQTALDGDQFQMYIQPQISAKTNKIIGGEALVRWEHPEKGLLTPDKFVKTLEKNGSIYEMDYYIWEKAAKTLYEWNNSDDPRFSNLSISVNISTKDFYHGDLYKVFTGLVTKYGIDPKLLKLEVTETVIVKDVAIFKTVLNQLKNYGFVIEMDDFGSGYSSLNALKDFPMDVLKIDMEFLRKTENEERSAVIVELIIEMAKGIGMEVITEGVEKKNHVDFLRKAGCDIFQGYYFAKPMPLNQFMDLVDKEEQYVK